MKEKTIEKRGMKMKKVFVTLLMLMMVVGLFAETKNDTAKVTATVGAVNKAWFAAGPGSTSSEEATKNVQMNPEALTASSTATIYAVGETNNMAGFSLKIYGTALTLVLDKGDESTPPEFDTKGNDIDILVTVNKDKGEQEESQKFTSAATATSASTTGEECLEIEIVPP